MTLDPVKQNSKTYLITVNYRSNQSILSLMTSIAALNNKLSEIKLIIVDSSSSCSTLIIEGDWNFEYEIIKLTKNMGFAYASNVGIRMAASYAKVANTESFIWLINPDTTLHPDSLNELITNSTNDSVLGSLITQKGFEAKSKVWGAGGFIDHNLNVSMGHHNDELKNTPKEIFECSYIPGCSIFFNSNLVKKNFEYLPEIYFLYFEETEWCQKLTTKNIKLKIIPTSLVEHESETDKMSSPFRVYFYNRNKFLFEIRNLKNSTKMYFTFWSFIGEIPKLFFISSKERNPEMKKIFKAHLFSKIDALIIALTFNTNLAAHISRKRLNDLRK